MRKGMIVAMSVILILILGCGICRFQEKVVMKQSLGKKENISWEISREKHYLVEDKLVMPWEDVDFSQFYEINPQQNIKQTIDDLCNEMRIKKEPNLKVLYREMDGLYLCYPYDSTSCVVAFNPSTGLFAYDFGEMSNCNTEDIEDLEEFVLCNLNYLFELNITGTNTTQIKWILTEKERTNSEYIWKELNEMEEWRNIWNVGQRYICNGNYYYIWYNVWNFYTWIKYDDCHITGFKYNDIQ